MASLLIRNARILDGDAADILIREGRIAGIGPNLEAPGVAVEEAAGAIAIPGLVDAHTHLDKSLLGWPWHRNEVGGGNLMAMIANERRVKRELDLDPQVQSLRHALQAVSLGTTLIRSHVDVDTDGGLRAMRGVLATAEQLAEVVEIETVAFPQSGLLLRPGTLALMDQALALGADLVGGLDPCGVDRDPKGHLDALFGLAEKHGKGLDIHLHERGALGFFSLEEILLRAEALDMKGQVAISHAFCLGSSDLPRVEALLERLAALDVRIMTTAPASVEVPPLARLQALGIKVGVGNDGIRDTWGPYGTGDMLERAKLLGLRYNLRKDDEVKVALELCSSGGAESLSKAPRALAVGAAGDLVLVAGESLAEAVVTHAPRKLVVKDGRVTARDGASLLQAP